MSLAYFFINAPNEPTLVTGHYVCGELRAVRQWEKLVFENKCDNQRQEWMVGKSGPAPTSPPNNKFRERYNKKTRLHSRRSPGGRVGVRRFELPTPTSLTWCANRAALHPEQ